MTLHTSALSNWVCLLIISDFYLFISEFLVTSHVHARSGLLLGGSNALPDAVEIGNSLIEVILCFVIRLICDNLGLFNLQCITDFS